MGDETIKQHVSIEERNKWSKVVVDFAAHLGSRGPYNHGIAQGTDQTAGFSQANFTTVEKTKLLGIEEGALNNPHPATHPITMITGTSTLVAAGTSWIEILNLTNPPSWLATLNAGTFDAYAVNGIRFFVQNAEPSKAGATHYVWFDTSTNLLKVSLNGGAWVSFRAVFG